MNLLMASGGSYPWVIVPVTRREEYMIALEAAGSDQNIRLFAEFLAKLLEA